MGITYEVLGGPGRDNALLVRIDSGQAITRLLFDCGEGCLSGQQLSELQSLDHLFFSHLHMDHVAGFDTFFRANYHRQTRPNVIWGPSETSRILQHRFQGYWWNLVEGQSALWRVHDIAGNEARTARFELAERFALTHDEGTRPLAPDDLSNGIANVILDTPDYQVVCLALAHHGSSLAYVVREKPRVNVNATQLAALGLRPGAWLKTLKESASASASTPPQQSAGATIEVDGKIFTLTDLQRDLLTESPGDSIAYLTDFLLDEEAQAQLIPVLRGCRTVVCESQYRSGDSERARLNHHVTSTQVAELARASGVGELILFHVSDRYAREGWSELLAEAQAIFPNTRFPAAWT